MELTKADYCRDQVTAGVFERLRNRRTDNLRRNGGESMSRYYLAVDIGASSGRHMLGHLEDGKMHLEEIYRFENGMAA